jgi:hypothetical protein
MPRDALLLEEMIEAADQAGLLFRASPWPKGCRAP